MKPAIIEQFSERHFILIGFVGFAVVFAVEWRFALQKCIWTEISFSDDTFFFFRENEIKLCSKERGFAYHPFGLFTVFDFHSHLTLTKINKTNRYNRN